MQIPENVSWAMMGVFGIILIVMGFQGSLGKMLGCLLTPSEIVVNTSGSF